jgi:hypothetical protein
MVSPQCTKRSGSTSSIAWYDVIPPSSSLIPQPWPHTSPDQTRLVGAGWIGAVANRNVCSSPLLPEASSNHIVASYSRPGASPRNVWRAVKSVCSSAYAPRTERSRRPLLVSRTRSSPGADAALHRTAESLVTSPERTPTGSSMRREVCGRTNPLTPSAPGTTPPPMPANRAVRRLICTMQRTLLTRCVQQPARRCRIAQPEPKARRRQRSVVPSATSTAGPVSSTRSVLVQVIDSSPPGTSTR